MHIKDLADAFQAKAQAHWGKDQPDLAGKARSIAVLLLDYDNAVTAQENMDEYMKQVPHRPC